MDQREDGHDTGHELSNDAGDHHIGRQYLGEGALRDLVQQPGDIIDHLGPGQSRGHYEHGGHGDDRVAAKCGNGRTAVQASEEHQGHHGRQRGKGHGDLVREEQNKHHHKQRDTDYDR